MDCLVIAAHPDDAELATGGILARLAAAGAETGILNLTRGEAATRGTPEERARESLEAARCLGIAENRVRTLDFGDGRLENTPENRLAVIQVLREWRPRMVLHHAFTDRHPDHEKAGRIAAEACYYARVGGIATGQPPFAPARRFLFRQVDRLEDPPAVIVDISSAFQTKMEAIRAYRSQFHHAESSGPQTYISTPEFLEQIAVRARYYGGMIGAEYGEPLWSSGPLSVRDPMLLSDL